MRLLLKRDVVQSPGCTHGMLYINGLLECYTLEDTDRLVESGGEKLFGETAIGRGKYEVIIDMSQRFRRELPRLLDVPQFSGIRIHSGNTAKDTEGCILVGTARGSDRVTNSRVALHALMEKMERAYTRNERIYIEVA